MLNCIGLYIPLAAALEKRANATNVTGGEGAKRKRPVFIISIQDFSWPPGTKNKAN